MFHASPTRRLAQTLSTLFERRPTSRRVAASTFATKFAVVALCGAFFGAADCADCADLANVANVASGAQPFDAANVPSWARRTAENGVWNVAFDAVAPPPTPRSSNARSASVSASLPQGVFNGRFSGALGASVDSSLVLRGQIQPPTVSPTTETQIGESTASFVIPPVMSDDPVFNPITPSTSEEETTIQKVFKYRGDASASYLFVPKGDDAGLGMHEVEGRLLFAFPWETMRERTCLNNGYFLLTPSFKYNHWSQSNVPSAPFEMPDSTFDAGLTTLLTTQLRDLEVKVELSVGLASSFKKVDGDAFYIRGRAMGALPIDNDKQVQATGGLIYYDRIEYKIVPSGGIIWRPNEQNVVRLVYPDPRWSRYLTKLNETDWWFYIGGEIGGGRWLIEDRAGRSFNTDYNDYRVGLGLTFDCVKMKGGFEVGGAFGRKLVSKQGVWYEPKDSVYLKTGFLF
ncbi:MAG: hypothetical protein IJ991_06745 [Thermoguttaceae bacterium]|nr:hypothetical protein [Thermoguttaceae bacterium]